ncbi:peroxiredoxin [Sphingosinicella sp.]|uniref:peroxiredoxin n=1 Tax=Sphingosinicella sp. TaxID=1917971 RepID=UPI0018397EEA|nr:peroxiredoxin [Sphingosinicella sp.]MBA4758713.1 peroxiredoxin [Sphingosinicella sp.]
MTGEQNVPAGPLQIGDAAPNFEARTTKGVIRLSDFRGRWLVLFSHPADFTPVCTSEFVALARASDRFAALDCALMAISVDSLYAHFGWIRAIRDGFGITIDFPIVEDPSLVIGRAYGMISDRSVDAAAMRSTFFIDPDGIIRAIITYPATIGRSVDEMLRVVAALQRVDSDHIVTPEGWQPGADVLLPPDQDQAALMARADDPLWFCRSAPDPGAGRG